MKDLYQNKRRATFKNRYSDFRDDLLTTVMALLVAVIWALVILNLK